MNVTAIIRHARVVGNFQPGEEIWTVVACYASSLLYAMPSH